MDDLKYLSNLKDNKILVIGAGAMGHGIAETLAIFGYNITLFDIKKSSLDKSKIKIEESLKKLQEKRKIKDSVVEILNRIKFSINFEQSLEEIRIVLEAVPEELKLKQKVLSQIEKQAPETLIYSNTSYIGIDEIAQTLQYPEFFAGMHFFNPVVLKKAVEIIPGSRTSAQTIRIAEELAKNINKISVVCKNSPGFVVNRVQAAAQVLLCRAVGKDLIKPMEIDAIMKNMGLPMGAFETMDFVGLDITLHGMNYLAKRLGKEYDAPRWLKDLVNNGDLGLKTGKGIYNWDQGKPNIDLSLSAPNLEVVDLMIVQINEGTKLLEQGVVKTPQQIDLLIKYGTGNPMGIFGLLKSLGKQKVIEKCEKISKSLDLKIFKPTEYLQNF